MEQVELGAFSGAVNTLDHEESPREVSGRQFPVGQALILGIAKPTNSKAALQPALDIPQAPVLEIGNTVGLVSRVRQLFGDWRFGQAQPEKARQTCPATADFANATSKLCWRFRLECGTAIA